MTQPAFGVDSASPFSPALLARVAAAYGPVAFWGRYTEQIAGVSTGLTRAEVAAIHAAGAGVLLCYNGALPGDAAAGYAVGYANGQLAAEHARALGAPVGTLVAIDIEAGWTLNPDFARGGMDAIHDGAYTPGLYLNAQGAQHAAAYLSARAASRAPVVLVWSSEPEFNAWRDTRLAQWYDFTQTPLGARGADVATHQYAEGELGDLVDLDVATEAGLAHMWQPPPAAWPRMMAARACGLLPRPAHGTPEIARIPALGQLLDSGRRVGDLAYVQWRDQQGWCQADLIVPLA